MFNNYNINLKELKINMQLWRKTSIMKKIRQIKDTDNMKIEYDNSNLR